MSDRDNGAAPGGTAPIGYGRPPAEHRFKPGQSGNPKGRPRRGHSTADVFEAMFRSIVTIVVDGKRRRVTVREAMAMRTKKEVLNGNPRVIERWLAYAEKVEQRSAERHADRKLDLTGLTDEQLRAIASIEIG